MIRAVINIVMKKQMGHAFIHFTSAHNSEVNVKKEGKKRIVRGLKEIKEGGKKRNGEC
jgi:hypothetical protein